ncbi:MAG: hypothetical protein GY739_12935 [Mesoflavibacter sp.]|nr:hypothetical protein [Mesoflavibacter sp.]
MNIAIVVVGVVVVSRHHRRRHQPHAHGVSAEPLTPSSMLAGKTVQSKDLLERRFVPGRHFYICGGLSRNETSNRQRLLDTCERYSFEENSWETLSVKMPTPLYYAASVADNSERQSMWVVGGKDIVILTQ